MPTVVKTDADIGEIRNPIDTAALERFFALSKDQVTQNKAIHLGPSGEWPLVSNPFSVKQFKYGQSNPTYLVTDSNGRRFALRRKPSPNAKLMSRKAHNIEREFWINHDIENLNLNQGYKVPIAKPYLLCEDESVIGAVFYISEFVQGVIFHHPGMPSVSGPARRQIWINLLKALVQVHQLPADGLPNSFPVKPKSSKTKYFQRQVKAMTAIEAVQSKVRKTPRINHFDELSKYLYTNAPSDPQNHVLIHGDFKIDNLIIDPDTYEIKAFLDWELSTIGNPIFDLANLLQNFHSSKEMNEAMLGFPIAEDPKWSEWVLQQYSNIILNGPSKDNGNLKTWLQSNGGNIVIDNFQYGTIFGLYRLSVIIQGIHSRTMLGVNSSGDTSKMLYTYSKYSELAKRLLVKAKL